MRSLLISTALLAMALATGPASAQAFCHKCCPGSGASGGFCDQTCNSDCGGHNPMRLMRNPKQCEPQYQLLSCKGPYCKWFCTK